MISKASIPNALTYARVGVIPLFVATFYLPASLGGAWLPLTLFLFACITDFFDGWLARKWQVESAIGRLLDPVADKLLVAAALIVLTAAHPILAIASIVILCREIFISALREYMAERNVVVHVTALAKWKTTLQMVALIVLLYAHGMQVEWLLWAGILSFYAAAALTAYTGWEYVKASLLN